MSKDLLDTYSYNEIMKCVCVCVCVSTVHQ